MNDADLGFDVETLMRIERNEQEPLVQDLRKLDELVSQVAGHDDLKEHMKIMWERYS
jgi:hypothetical protein